MLTAKLYIIFISIYGYYTYSIITDTAGGSGDQSDIYEFDSSIYIRKAVKYLKQYNYLDNRPLKSPDQETYSRRAIREATVRFQQKYQKYGLDVTGELDEKTLDLMDKPRCGVSDNPNTRDNRNLNKLRMRRRRYLITGGKWNKKNFVYNFVQYPQDQDLLPEVVDKEVARAFAQWEQYSTLTFSRSNSISTNDNIDFEMKFVPSKIDHGDGSPFDGKDGTYAHAFYPNNPHPDAGDIHFDEAEDWTSGTQYGINFYQVVTHEIGHSLGLGHSNEPNSVMSPYYNGYNPSYTLTSDDIEGIQTIYGVPVTTTTTTRKPIYYDQSLNEQLFRRVCQIGRLDAISYIKDTSGVKRIVAFQGPYYFIINNNGGVRTGYPRRIRDDFDGAPDNIDAAFYLEMSRENGVTYILKGNYQWRIVDMRIADHYPSIIQDHWDISDVDTAYFSSANGKIYFMTGNQYFRYTWFERVADGGYPLKLSANWNGLPNSKIDASLLGDNGVLYFFSGYYYYAFYQGSTKIKLGYPKDIRKDWLKCPYTGSASTLTGRLLYIVISLLYLFMLCL